jgi:DNA primase
MTRSSTIVKLEFLPIKGKKGIYFDPNYQPERLSLSAALELFAPTYEDLEGLKNDLVENMQFTISEIKRQHPAGMNQDEFDDWFREEFGIGRKRLPEPVFEVFMEIQLDLQKMMIEEATEQPRRSLKRIVQRQQHMLTPAKKQGGVTEAQIEQAREVPIEDMIHTRVFKATGKWTANAHCPLTGHEGEKTPSFYVDKHNRYKCFGCHGKGDAIDFVMQRDGVDFIRAVKSLIR